MIYVKKNSSAV